MEPESIPQIGNLDRESAIENAMYYSTRPRTPKTGFYSTGEETAYGRRRRRMQEDWDKRHQMMVEQEKLARDVYESDRAYRMELEKFEIDKENERLKRDREEQINKEAKLVFEMIRGGQQIGPNKFSEPIRPSDSDAISKLNGLMSLPYAMENTAAREAVKMLLDDATRFQQDAIQKSQEQEAEAVNLSVRGGKAFSEFGQYTPEGLFKPNAETMITESSRLAEEEKKKEEEATAKKQKASRTEEEIARLSREYVGARAALQSLPEKGGLTARREAESEIAKLNAQLKEIVPRVASKQEYDNLSSGSYYTDPNGTLKRKK